MRKETIYKAFRKIPSQATNIFRSVSVQSVGIEILLILLSASLTGLLKRKEDLDKSTNKTYRTTSGQELIVENVTEMR